MELQTGELVRHFYNRTLELLVLLSLFNANVKQKFYIMKKID